MLSVGSGHHFITIKSFVLGLSEAKNCLRFMNTVPDWLEGKKDFDIEGSLIKRSHFQLSSLS